MKKTKIALLFASIAIAGMIASCSRATGNDDLGKDSNNPDVVNNEDDGPLEDDEPLEDDGKPADEGGDDDGGNSQIPAGWSDTLPTSGGAMKRGDYYFALEKMEPDKEKDSANNQYGNTSVTLSGGDELSFFVDGEAVTVFATPDANAAERGNSTAVENIHVVDGGELGVYLKHYNEDTSWVIYISGLLTTGPGEGTGDENKDTGFGIKVGTEGAVQELLGGEPWDMDKTYTQWYLTNVSIEAGQEIIFYDYSTKAEFGKNMAVDSASVGSWTPGTVGLICDESGTYDIYLKLKYEADNVYFGHSAAQ